MKGLTVSARYTSLLVLLHYIVKCSGYPIIFEAVHNDRACMDLNIPDGDDAHLLFLPLPESIETEVEDWFFTELSEMSRPSSVQFLKDLAKMPQHLSDMMRQHKNRARISVMIEEEETKVVTKNQALEFFRPTIIKNIAKGSKGWDVTRGNYRICVNARGSTDIRTIFDMIKISEYQDQMEKRHVVKKDHLTPLERAFDESAALAKSIMDEMHYMEKREIRMKRTADGTNARIRWFSYLSILILLGVTWVQMKYLKGYFRKKKIL
mmetsp:Transcript_2490/g.4654  ORF Transcript_2490/g.4654 Transcript_2490/m.4654 type:complete len:265 (+) Transcript_2490:81-875(+)